MNTTNKQMAKKLAEMLAKEEIAGYKVEERSKQLHGYDQLLNAAAAARSARAAINTLIGDRKFSGERKAQLQQYLQPLQDMQRDLTNMAYGGNKPNEKVLKP